MPHLIILGAGFAGLELAKQLIHSPFEITLIDRTNHHLFQPLLYQVAGACLAPSEIATPIRELVKSAPNVHVLMDEAIGIDSVQKKIKLRQHGELSYDTLVIAVGNRSRLPHDNSWHPHVLTLKSLEDALNLRRAILHAYEQAEWTGKPPHFAIIGAGPTGVELAGTLAEMAQISLKNNFRKVHSDDTRITLLEAADRVLRAYAPTLSEYTVKCLKQHGIDVITAAKIKKIEAGRIVLESEILDVDVIVWTAGTDCTVLASNLQDQLTEDGRIRVDAYLRVSGMQDVYALGDCAYFETSKGPLPALAPVAKQQGYYLAQQLMHKTQKPFVYFDKGSLAIISQSQAVGHFAGINFKGFLAWLVWAFVHIYYLIGTRNKFFVICRWILSYFKGGRSCRLIESGISKACKS